MEDQQGDRTSPRAVVITFKGLLKIFSFKLLSVLDCSFVFREVTIYACLIVASTANVKIAFLTCSDYRKPCFSVILLSFLMGFTPL